ncbi:amino acid adenylation domain-containing protein [Micromonospora sp. NPDC050276]|uniref:amino acid adenylation domain-containing protein n=1 Tax=Micromonospora sp. NPDC050276 TaxID=3364278 RepID=UPI00379EF730
MSRARPQSQYAVVTMPDSHPSIWPDAAPPPRGWRRSGFVGNKQQCLDHIASTWPSSRLDVLPAPDMASVHGLFHHHARARPQAPALRWQGSETSYGDLNSASAGLALRLREAGVRPGDIVPVRLGRSPGLVAALLAVMRSGAAYVAVPKDWPADRLAVLCQRSRSTVAVDDRFDETRWPRTVQTVTITPDLGPGADNHHTDEGVEGAVACIFFTSGSTGTPKGAICPHTALINLLHEPAFASYGKDTVTLQAAALPWDAFALELWGALLNGGCCVLGPAGPLGPDELRTAICRDGVNTLWLTSSLFNVLLDIDLDCFQGARTVMIGGERLSAAHVRRFRRRYPDTVLINGYGPVEATVFATTHRIDDVADGSIEIPIGRPVPGATLRILDEAGRETPPGHTGELHVSGRGLCLGYLHDPRETALRFVPVDDGVAYRTGDLVSVSQDGVLHYLGRADRQVKLRGVRIEPGEVEAALRDCRGIADAAVVRRLGPQGQVVDICAWYTGEAWEPTALRQELLRRLPPPLIPGVFSYLVELPRGASGKIDVRELERRSALAAANGTDPLPAGVDKGDDTERMVLTAMAEVLGQAVTARNSDFFHLGGTSLTAIVLAGRLSAASDRRITAADVLQAGSASALAEAVRTAPATPPPPTDEPAVSAGQRRLWLADQIDPGNRHVKVHRLFEIDGIVDEPALTAALADVAEAHPALRHGIADTDKGLGLLPLAPAAAAVLTVAPPIGAAAELLERPQTWDVSTTGPTIRLSLAQLQGQRGRSALALVAHHAFIDGWSLRIVQEDLAAAYRARRSGKVPRLPSEAIGYAAWASSTLTSDASGRRAFWQENLRGSTDLSWPAPRRAEDADLLSTWPVDLSPTVRRSAREQHTTISAMLLAAVAAALHDVAGVTDLCVAVPVARREDPGVTRTVGLFMDTVPVRLRPHSSDPTDLVTEAHDALLSALRHAMAFDDIVAAVQPSRSGRPTLCQVAVLRHLHPNATLHLAGASVRTPPPPPSGGMYEMTVEFWPTADGGWSGSLQCRADAVPPGLGDRIHRTLTGALKALEQVSRR